MKWIAKLCVIAAVFLLPEMRAEAQSRLQNRYEVTPQQALKNYRELRRLTYIYDLSERRAGRRGSGGDSTERKLSDYPYCRTGTFGRITNKPCRPRLHTRGVRKGSRR